MKGKEAWLVASYEIHMLEELLQGRHLRKVILNAITESIVLHARQLCEIFLSRSTEADNIKLVHLVPKIDQSERLKKLINELDKSYGSRKEEGSACWVFNKMLLHPTTERLDGYNYEPALKAVVPILEKIVHEIESARSQEFDRQIRA